MDQSALGIVVVRGCWGKRISVLTTEIVSNVRSRMSATSHEDQVNPSLYPKEIKKNSAALRLISRSVERGW